jgi:hypothetical protein
MIYVFDTSSILELQAYYPATFPSFWERMDDLVLSGEVVSVAEVRKEIDAQVTATHILDWVDLWPQLFTIPAPQEQAYVAEIFAIPHFRQLVGVKQLERGMPVADPFIVARGRHLPACVVTEESYKQNAAKIPNVCKHFSVDCIKLKEFLQRQGWRW